MNDISIHIVETSTDIQKEGADLATRALEGADCVNQDSAGVEGGEYGQGATLVWRLKVNIARHSREPGHYDPSSAKMLTTSDASSLHPEVGNIISVSCASCAS